MLLVTSGALFFLLKVQGDHTGFGMRLVGSELDMGVYPAVGPVAQCDRFTPPPGTRSLCERTPPDERPTRDWYYWDPNSPGRKLLAARPDLHEAIKLWASRALEAQAGDVRHDQLVAFQRLFGLGGDRRPLGESDTEQVSLRSADTGSAQVVVTAIQAYYGPSDAPTRPAGFPYGVLEDLRFRQGHRASSCYSPSCSPAQGPCGTRSRPPLRDSRCRNWLVARVVRNVDRRSFNWRYVLLGVPFIAIAAFGAVSALLARRTARKLDHDADLHSDRDDVESSSSPQLVSAHLSRPRA